MKMHNSTDYHQARLAFPGDSYSDEVPATTAPEDEPEDATGHEISEEEATQK
jgi:hypothetical protein